MRTAVFCKSFRDDFGRLGQFLESCHRFVALEEVPVLLSVPAADLALAQETAAAIAGEGPGRGGVTLISDESYADPAQHLDGWCQQQVCKLCVHRIGFADTYFMADSDFYFVRPFAARDFLGPDGSPRLAMSPLFTAWSAANAPLAAHLFEAESPFADGAPVPAEAAPEPVSLAPALALWAADRGAPAMRRGRWIDAALDRAPPGLCYQPGQWFVAAALARLEADVRANGLTLPRLIALAPWEYNWYGAYCAHTRCIAFTPSVSPVLHFATDAAVEHALARGLTEARIAARFAAVAMAARHHDRVRF